MSINNKNSFHIDDVLKITLPTIQFVIDGMKFLRNFNYEDLYSNSSGKYSAVDVTCWKIIGNDLERITNNKFCDFYDNECYFIQKDYKIGEEIKALYFYWKGSSACKGFSPLPKEIENENPPVTRIVKWSEPSVFLEMFEGKFTVHNSNKESRTRLYILRGEIEEEAHLFEVPAKANSLRSRTSFLIKEPKKIFIWHGCKSPQQSRKVIKNISHRFSDDDNEEILEVEEGVNFPESDRDLFKKEDYYSFLNDLISFNASPRLYYYYNFDQKFGAEEVVCPHQSQYITPFPFLQEHLYSAPQPAIFFLIDDTTIWIWRGCSSKSDSEPIKNNLQTLIKAALKYKKTEAVYLVHAGIEPLEFTNLFPYWTEKQDITQQQLKNGRKLGEKIIVNENLQIF